MNLVFDGGTVDAETYAAVTPQDDELDGVAVLSLEEAGPRLRPSQSRRLAERLPLLDAAAPRYLEFSRPAGLTAAR